MRGRGRSGRALWLQREVPKPAGVRPHSGPEDQQSGPRPERPCLPSPPPSPPLPLCLPSAKGSSLQSPLAKNGSLAQLDICEPDVQRNFRQMLRVPGEPAGREGSSCLPPSLPPLPHPARRFAAAGQGPGRRLTGLDCSFTAGHRHQRLFQECLWDHCHRPPLLGPTGGRGACWSCGRCSQAFSYF